MKFNVVSVITFLAKAWAFLKSKISSNTKKNNKLTKNP